MVTQATLQQPTLFKPCVAASIEVLYQDRGAAGAAGAAHNPPLHNSIVWQDFLHFSYMHAS